MKSIYPLPICKLKSKEKSSNYRLRKTVWYPPLVLSILILGSFFRTIPSEAIWTDLSSGCGSNQPFFPFSPKSWAMGNLSLCIANGKHISDGFPKEIVFARSYWNQSFKLDKFEYISDLFTLTVEYFWITVRLSVGFQTKSSKVIQPISSFNFCQVGTDE